MNCTQVVQTIGDQLAGALDKAFGSKRVRVAVVREQKDAPWWTEECGLARLAMLDYKARRELRAGWMMVWLKRSSVGYVRVISVCGERPRSDTVSTTLKV